MVLVSDEIASSPHRPSYERFVTQDMSELLRRSVPVMRDDAPAKFRLAYDGMDLRSPTTTASDCLRLSETYACTVFLCLHIIEAHMPHGGELATNPPWEICLGQLPQLTTRGTFIVKGLERVPIAQLRPAAGVFLSVHEHPRSFHQTWRATFRPRRGAHMRLIVEQLARDANRYHFWMDSSLTQRLNLAGCLRAMGLWDDVAKKLAQEPLWGQVDVDGPVVVHSDQAAVLQERLFGSHEAYDLSTEGREQLNRRLGPLADELECTLGAAQK